MDAALPWLSCLSEMNLLLAGGVIGSEMA